MNSVAVCVATCRRPEELGRLLGALERLRPPPDVLLRFVIVDNDPEGSARALVEGAAPFLPGPAAYAVEPRPGVSQARNAALRLAAPAPLAAFLDDDTTPEPDWLDRLLACQRETGAVAVSGRVRPAFDRPVPAWLAGTFELCYIRPGRPGRALSELHTCNLLLDLAWLGREGLAFDEALGGQGGEDTGLAQAILARGGRLDWCEEAVVHEHIPHERARLAWLLRRWMRYGGTEIVLAAKARSPGRARLQGVLRGGARVLAGSAWLVVTLPQLALGDAEPAVRRLYTIMRGAGMIAAACGYIRHDYGAAAR